MTVPSSSSVCLTLYIWISNVYIVHLRVLTIQWSILVVNIYVSWSDWCGWRLVSGDIKTPLMVHQNWLFLWLKFGFLSVVDCFRVTMVTMNSSEKAAQKACQQGPSRFVFCYFCRCFNTVCMWKHVFQQQPISWYSKTPCINLHLFLKL